MSKGTPSFGKRNKITHIKCRRCGGHSFHKTKKRCARCGYPDARLRKFRWQWKQVIGMRNRKK